jgi:hypothetical protein
MIRIQASFKSSRRAQNIFIWVVNYDSKLGWPLSLGEKHKINLFAR